MKKVVTFVVVAIFFTICGYLIGSSQYTNSSANTTEKHEIVADYKDAYKKGWIAWFSDYGLHGEGAQYMNYYIYGRNYDDVFTNPKDAFFAGYRDGFYFVNKHEIEESYHDQYMKDLYEERMEKAYEMFYLD